MQNIRRGSQWKCWSYAYNDIRDYKGEKVWFKSTLYSKNANLLSRYQSRAFLLLPMCFNIGVIIGPILGGLLADPAGSYPDNFGAIGWLRKFPYAPPNILSACFLLTAATGVFLGLEEVEYPKYIHLSGH
jgi:MFS family permease